jgi:hypothetical protein
MAANTTPIFLRTPKINFVAMTSTAVTDYTGIDANYALAFTADATNGSKINSVLVVALGSATATVVRFYVNNGTDHTQVANNTLVHEETFATVSTSQVAAVTYVQWNANLALPPGYKLYVSHGTATASGFAVTAVGGDY